MLDMLYITPIFNTIKNHPMSHCATLVTLPNNNILAAWFSGAYETSNDQAIFWSIKRKDEDWTQPEIFLQSTGNALGQPLFFLNPNGQLWFFFVKVNNPRHHQMKFDSPPPKDSWYSAKPYFIKSDDNGKSWKSPQNLIDYPGLMVRSKPLLVNRKIILPVYDEIKWESKMLISKDNGISWSITDPIITPNGNIQPTIFVGLNGSLIAYLRPGGNGGFLWRTISKDDGETWTNPTKTNIPNPNSGFDLIKLNSGNLLLAYNNSSTHRTPLSIAISGPDEKWEFKLNVESGVGEYAYPTLLQTSDRRLHIAYTYRRRHIRYSTFTEDWLLSKK